MCCMFVLSLAPLHTQAYNIDREKSRACENHKSRKLSFRSFRKFDEVPPSATEYLNLVETI